MAISFSELSSEALFWIWSVIYRLVNLLGGAAIGAAQLWCSFKKQEPPVKAYWWVIVACLVIASFQAWRDEYKRAKGKYRRKILQQIIDEFWRVKLPGEPRPDWIGLVIEHSEDFTDRHDLSWVCKELSRQHSDPFGFFTCRYTKRSFGSKKRFKFIGNAHTEYFGGKKIDTDLEAAQYLETIWADQNKLVPFTGDAGIRATILRAFLGK